MQASAPPSLITIIVFIAPTAAWIIAPISKAGPVCSSSFFCTIITVAAIIVAVVVAIVIASTVIPAGSEKAAHISHLSFIYVLYYMGRLDKM
ncbi:hypothetical protein [Lacrimispora indolis]|uniref:hypothetical protein n=1 Tax=Lacrimispora indolis TaxID=69825 RepID=UPI000413013A|nr:MULTISPECIES: hypothetical protein [Lachnospiraceae]